MILELRNALLLFCCATMIWAILAWPPKKVAHKYPFKTRLLLTWPFGAAWLNHIDLKDAPFFESYQRRARIGLYFAGVAAILSLAP